MGRIGVTGAACAIALTASVACAGDLHGADLGSPLADAGAASSDAAPPSGADTDLLAQAAALNGAVRLSDPKTGSAGLNAAIHDASPPPSVSVRYSFGASGRLSPYLTGSLSTLSFFGGGIAPASRWG
ncbi:MAG: hypothetical protein ACHP7N_02625 [Caulobacterales bacterium]